MALGDNRFSFAKIANGFGFGRAVGQALGGTGGSSGILAQQMRKRAPAAPSRKRVRSLVQAPA